MIINLILTLLFLPSPILAAGQYTIDDVGLHNTENDCWMTYDNNIYDFTQYLSSHDKFSDIRQWCGSDMTEDFKTKADLDRDHLSHSYTMLDVYYIGELVTEDTASSMREKMNTKNPYNLIIPLIGSLLLYWISYFICKRSSKILKFNAFWNTVLFLTLLIPSLGFGIFMIVRYMFPNLYNIDFDFMYWHVELSIVMGVVAMSHLIQRFKVYLVQIKN